MSSTGESAHHTVITEVPARLDRLPRSRWALDDRFGQCQYRLSDGERDLPDGDPRALLSSGVVGDAVAAFSVGTALMVAVGLVALLFAAERGRQVAGGYREPALRPVPGGGQYFRTAECSGGMTVRKELE